MYHDIVSLIVDCPNPYTQQTSLLQIYQRAITEQICYMYVTDLYLKLPQSCHIYV